MKTNKKYFIMLCTLIIIFTSSYLLWITCLKQPYLTQISVFGDMLILESGVYEFIEAKHRLPISFKEIVEQGFLPSESKNYFCPLIHGSFIRKKYSYKDCDYKYLYFTNSAKILIPDFKLNNDYIKKIPIDFRTIDIDKPSASN